ncbi:MAG: hypothetical protein JF614_02850, partial [Acidobacteria bacterium]|nr:hypothetical protein [Acidobacteriota bacterium]
MRTYLIADHKFNLGYPAWMYDAQFGNKAKYGGNGALMHDTVGIMRGCSSKVKTIQQLLYFIILTFLGNEASAQSRPDIVPQNISVSPASVAAGGGTTVFFTVRNQGSASAGPTTTRLRLSTSASGPSLSDPVLADVNTPSIAAGSSVSQNAAATIPAGTANGTYHIWVILDNFSAIQQSNTSNDFGSTTISVSTAPQLPDLVPQNISVSPASVAAGGGTTVFFTVRNQGSGSAGSTTTRLRLSTSPSGPSLSDPVLADVSTPSIAPGSSVSQNAAVTIPAGTANGTYYIWVILDNFSTIQQSNNSNDFGSTTVSVSTAPQFPDLVPQNISVSPASV